MVVRRCLAVLGLGLAVAGCRAKPVATVVLTAPGTAEATFQLGAKPVELWADTDGTWSGNKRSTIHIDYDIEVIRDGATVSRSSCTTQDARGSICGVRASTSSGQSGDCEFPLSCSVPALPPGPVTLRVTGRTGPSVTQVALMSVDVRER